ERSVRRLGVNARSLLRRKTLRRATLHELFELKDWVLRLDAFGQHFALALYAEQARDEAREVLRRRYQKFRLGLRAAQLCAALGDVLGERVAERGVCARDLRVEDFGQRAKARGAVEVAVCEAFDAELKIFGC